MESGTFAKPFMEDHGGVKTFGDQAHNYALRLVFDGCPWPLPEEYIGDSIRMNEERPVRFVCRDGRLYNNSWGCLVMYCSQLILHQFVRFRTNNHDNCVSSYCGRKKNPSHVPRPNGRKAGAYVRRADEAVVSADW